MVTDPVSDLLTRVRNGSRARHLKVDVPHSQLKVSIVDIWKKAGFIKNYRLYKQDNKGIIRIYLKYVDKTRPIIEGLRRISRPGRRVYAGYEKLPKIMGGLGISILSTSRGVLSDEVARTNKVGGEVLCAIW